MSKYDLSHFTGKEKEIDELLSKAFNEQNRLRYEFQIADRNTALRIKVLDDVNTVALVKIGCFVDDFWSSVPKLTDVALIKTTRFAPLSVMKRITQVTDILSKDFTQERTELC